MLLLVSLKVQFKGSFKVCLLLIALEERNISSHFSIPYPLTYILISRACLQEPTYNEKFLDHLTFSLKSWKLILSLLLQMRTIINDTPTLRATQLWFSVLDSDSHGLQQMWESPYGVHLSKQIGEPIRALSRLLSKLLGISITQLFLPSDPFA